MKTRYETYIQSHHWRARRDAYARTFEPRRRGCSGKDDMNLHHLTYARMGRELDDDLMWLCETCHRLVHEYHRIVGGSLSEATWHVVRRLTGPGMQPDSQPRPPAGRCNPLDSKLASIRNARRERLARQGYGEPIK